MVMTAAAAAAVAKKSAVVVFRHPWSLLLLPRPRGSSSGYYAA
jgi:hypothetical protein